MTQKFTNNAVSTLAAAITSGATSLSVFAGDGALFPALSGGDTFTATLVDGSGNIEIVLVTARATDTFTITRAQEGTTAIPFAAGDSIELRVTANALNNFLSALAQSLTTAQVAQIFSNLGLGVTGMVAHFPATAAPSGWAKANGQSVSRTGGGANLWAFAQASGNLAATEAGKAKGQFGPGDGVSTFTLPNLNGEFIRAADDGAGVDTGRALGSWQNHQFQDHLHASNNTLDGSALSASGSAYELAAEAGLASNAVQTSNPINGNHGTETRPRNVALLACIKL